MENMKGMSKMANAVEKMFDLTLFDPLSYFPNHATCPDKFWEVIDEIEDARGIDFDLMLDSDDLKQSQIKIARRFNKEFKKVIVTNPVNLVDAEIDYNDRSALKAHMAAHAKFTDEITSLFRAAIIELIEAQ
jgi:hypothetical protein